MAPELRAIPDVLSHVGTELVSHAQALLGVQRSCHRDVDDAQQGWVGTSAAALSDLLHRWAVTGAGHLSRLTEHAEGLRFAAGGFSDMERTNGASLR